MKTEDYVILIVGVGMIVYGTIGIIIQIFDTEDEKK